MKQLKYIVLSIFLVASLPSCTVVIGSEDVKVERASKYIDPTLIELDKEVK